MNRRLWTVLLPVSAGLLSGCSWFYGEDGLVRDTEYDYVQARQGADLKVPAEYQRFRTSNEFVVPQVAPKVAEAPVGTSLDVNPPALVLSTGDGVFAQQDAVVPSAVIVGDETLLWDRLGRFFSESNIAIKERQQEQGKLVTDWVQTEEAGWWDRWMSSSDAHAWRWKYRFSVEPGERPNERLVSVQALNAETLDGDGNWQAASADRRHSVDMLNRFLGFYDTELNRAARERVMASRAGIKLDLWQDEQGVPALLARSGLDNTWESTPDVLGTLGFQLEDKDTTKRLYYFKLEDGEKGFWDKLAFWSDDGEQEIRVELEKGEYLVQLAPVGENTSLVISRADGEPLSSEVLARLYPTLAEAFQERRPQRLLDARR